MFEKLAASATYIKSIKPALPKVGIVLGSGLGNFIEHIENRIDISFNDIPFFPEVFIDGQNGTLMLGQINGVDIAVLHGRLHAYDGVSMSEVVYPVRVLATIGIESLILTGGAGGINSSFIPGDLVAITDHINFLFQNPLIEKNIRELGPKFPNMRNAYDVIFQQVIQKCADQLAIQVKQGVYLSWLGPTYETPAEIKMLKILGADMVGMSTVPECIAANHLGVKVAGIMCITNMAAGIISNYSENQASPEMQAHHTMDNFSNLLKEMIIEINKI